MTHRDTTALFLLAALAASCSLIVPAAGDGPDADSDSDSDSDTDEDTDVDTDTGVDTDTDSDSDTDTDTGSETEVDGGDVDTDTDTGSDTDTAIPCVEGSLDTSTGLCWSPPTDSTSDIWAARDHCLAMALDGAADWRLPTRDEMVALLSGCDSSVLSGGSGWCNSCADSPACTALLGYDAWSFWTGTAKSGDGWSDWWTIQYGAGSVDWDYCDGLHRAHCVRSTL
jgi:hypothetical protein